MADILVVDDEFLLAVLLADSLEDEGHAVQIAANGKAALIEIGKRRPDLIITDFMMPIMTGLELAQMIRADLFICTIPIILVSGAQGSMARRHPELFNAVFDKPYRHEMLMAEVERQLARKMP